MTIAIKSSPRHSWIIAGAAAIAIFAGGAQASNVEPQITVRITKDSDASQVYARLQTASASVCRQHDGKELRHFTATRACYNEALNDAVEKMGDSELTTLHHANVAMRVAQRDMNRRRS